MAIPQSSGNSPSDPVVPPTPMPGFVPPSTDPVPSNEPVSAPVSDPVPTETPVSVEPEVVTPTESVNEATSVAAEQPTMPEPFVAPEMVSNSDPALDATSSITDPATESKLADLTSALGGTVANSETGLGSTAVTSDLPPVEGEDKMHKTVSAENLVDSVIAEDALASDNEIKAESPVQSPVAPEQSGNESKAVEKTPVKKGGNFLNILLVIMLIMLIVSGAVLAYLLLAD